jgi:hypothetical protein
MRQRKGEWVQGQVGEEVLMEAYVQVDTVERLGILLGSGSDQRNVSRVPGALEEHLTGGC